MAKVNHYSYLLKKLYTSLYSQFNNPMKLTQRKSLGIVVLGCQNDKFQVRLRSCCFAMTFNGNNFILSKCMSLEINRGRTQS